MPLLCLEGVDGSGKSTLASALSSALRDRGDTDATEIINIHRGPLNRSPLNEYALDIESALQAEKIIIADRWHLGENVYGPLYRGKSRMSTGQFRWIELFLQTYGATLVHVTQPLEVIRSRLAARGETFLKPEHYSTVINKFHDVFKQTALGSVEVSPTGDVSGDVEKVLTAYDYYRARPCGIYAKYLSVVGDSIPQMLLVGDERGGKPPHRTTRALMATGGNSGDYLLSSLPEKIWKNIALANSLDEGENIVDLVADLFDPPVVALGFKAHERLNHYGIAHGAVPHPQYIRRFYHSKKNAYGQLIVDAAMRGEQKLSWPK